MRAERLTAQLLAGPPAADAEGVAERLLAVQAQDARAARLAVRSRTRGLTAAHVDRALTEERSLVVSWLNRGTLHLVRSEDFRWLHALTGPPQLASTRRRLGQEGVPEDAAERGVALVERSLADDGPLTRAELGARLARAGVPTAGQALVHVLALASLRGTILRGPMRGREQAFALVRDWLGTSPPVDRDRALAELARRYLAGHGPADERDLARWSGLPLRDARAGLTAIARRLVRRDDGRVSLRGAAPEAVAGPRLLGGFEPLLLGWAVRDWVLGGHAGVVTSNGIFRPIALVDGRAAGTWAMPQGRVRVEPFMPLGDGVAAALAADAEDVRRFLGAAGD